MSENGQEMEPYQPFKHPLEDISTSCPLPTILSPMTTMEEKILSIPELVPESNLEICKTKRACSKKNTRTIKASKTSEVVSTTKDKALLPFWNNYSKEKSNEWWCPTKTVLADSDLNFSNGSSNNSELYWKVWNTTLPIPEKIWSPTSWKFSPSLQPDTTEAENIVRSLKLRIYPNKNQKKLLNQCFGTHRFFYNRAVNEINTRYTQKYEEFKSLTHCVHCEKQKIQNSFCCEKHEKKKLPWKLNIQLPSIRKCVLKSDKEAIQDPKLKWTIDIPYDTRQLAIKDAITAYKSCVTNKQRGHIDTFRLQFMRRTSKRLFWIDSSALKIKNNKVYLFTRRLKEDSELRLHSKSRKKLPKINKHDAKIYYDRGAYYIILSISEPIDPNLQTIQRQPIVALDPGIRSFITGYSPTGTVFKMGEHQLKNIKKLQEKIDLLRSVRSKHPSRRTKWRLKQRLEIIGKHLYGTVDNLHNQIGSYLTKEYKTILLPTFRTSEMQKGDCLSSTVKRNMNCLSHYRFYEKLKFQCIKKGNILYRVGEEYTTQTCGKCGILKKVGCDKIYQCNECGYKMDRDIHGARNILLKTMTHYGA